jgi:hypothetical protein
MGLATSKRALDAFRRVSQVRGWPTSEGILARCTNLSSLLLRHGQFSATLAFV